MRLPVPAPGFVTITGKKRPNRAWGDALHCQLRDGTVDPYGKPWPVKTSVFIHDGSNCDVVAVRKATS